MRTRSFRRWGAGPGLATLLAFLVFAGRSAGAAPTTFGLVGDFGNGSAEEAAVAARLKSFAPQFVLTLGDNNYLTGSVADMDRAIGRDYHAYIKYPANSTSSYRTQGASQINFYPVVGNHDWDAGIASHSSYYTFPKANTRYYDVVRGPVHFFLLDSDPREPDGVSATSTQATWLKSALAQSTAPWKLVLTHHPPYASYSADTTMRWPFARWGATAVLSGHAHLYEQGSAGGLSYFVNGLGGEDIHTGSTPISTTRLLYDGDYGFMLGTADDASLRLRFITRAGQVIDSLDWHRDVLVPAVPEAPVPPSLLVPAALALRRRARRAA
jgi:hypothetical protein